MEDERKYSIVEGRFMEDTNIVRLMEGSWRMKAHIVRLKAYMEDI